MSNEKKDEVAVGKKKRVFITKPGAEDGIYANVFEVNSTLYDFKVQFGKRGEAEDGNHKGEQIIYMSPEHYKEMVAVALQVLKEHEALFGPIASFWEIDSNVRLKQSALEKKEGTFIN